MAQNTVIKKKIRQSWVTRQVFSAWNILPVIAFGALSLAPIGVVLIVMLAISVIAALFKIPSLVVTAIIISIVTFIFPPLAAIISVVFFLMKLAYIVEHYRPLLIGVGLSIYLVYSTQQVYYLWENQLLFSIALFQIVLVYLYRKEYSAQEAVTIIATVPLFIVMLILPFLLSQLEEMDDLFDIDSYDDFVSEQNPVYQEQDLTPDTHWVEGHLRENPDGSSTFVDGHIRTNPDGIESNNLS